MAVTDNFEYDFKALNPSEYELIINMHTTSRVMKLLFTRARAKLLRKKGIDAAGNIDNIQAFDITKEYFPYLKIVLKKIVNMIAKEIKQDKIELLDYTVHKGKFIRNMEIEGVWDIIINLRGLYVDKR